MKMHAGVGRHGPSCGRQSASSRLVSSRLVSSRLVSSRLVSSRLVSSRLVSSRLVSSRLVSSRLVSSRLVSSRLVSSRLVSSLYMVPGQLNKLPHVSVFLPLKWGTWTKLPPFLSLKRAQSCCWSQILSRHKENV